MTNTGRFWTPEEDGRLVREGASDFSLKEWGKLSSRFPGRTGTALRIRFAGKGKARVPESPYPRYDTPLEYVGDALVLPDPEFPYHDDTFINQVLDLAAAWDIRHCVVAGDALHFNSLSAWEPGWTISGDDELAGPNLGQELRVASGMLRTLADQFDDMDYILGNHEGRMIRALGAVVSPDFLTNILSLDKKWRISPFYFSRVLSEGVPYLIEHPRTTSLGAPGVLADKFQANILMAHSHKVGMTSSRSGQWQGWHIGACVDESRLPYASQRHNAGNPHKLGAAIVRGGFLYPLFDGWVDWERLRKAT